MFYQAHYDDVDGYIWMDTSNNFQFVIASMKQHYYLFVNSDNYYYITTAVREYAISHQVTNRDA
jgi:hypothetical protein